MNDDIIDKIKKLLRLGRSPNPHEAELAIQRAFELASRHQLDIESISLEDDARQIVAEKFPHGARTSFARKKILNLLKAFFNVNIVIESVSPRARALGLGKPVVTFIGTPVDIQIARHVYEFLYRSCAQALADFNRQRKCKPAASTQQNFVQGWIYGVTSKLREAKAKLTEHTHAIVLHESARRDRAQSELYNPQDLKPVKADLRRTDREAAWRGFREGEKVEIRKPIASNAAG